MSDVRILQPANAGDELPDEATLARLRALEAEAALARRLLEVQFTLGLCDTREGAARFGAVLDGMPASVRGMLAYMRVSAQEREELRRKESEGGAGQGEGSADKGGFARGASSRLGGIQGGARGDQGGEHGNPVQPVALGCVEHKDFNKLGHGAPVQGGGVVRRLIGLIFGHGGGIKPSGAKGGKR